MNLKFHLLILLSVLLAAPNISFADADKKGHGAGGVRADHASDKGLEKGKAWAGSKESEDSKEPRYKDDEKNGKDKKDKKNKKDKKDKK